MAELADATGLGPVELRLLEVRVLPPAQRRKVRVRLRDGLFGGLEPVETKQLDVVARSAVEGEVGEDLTDD